MYLDPWVFGKINTGRKAEKESEAHASLTRKDLDLYSDNKRRELLAFLMEKSPFYQKHLADFIISINGSLDGLGSSSAYTLDQWENIPFTTATHIANEGEQMLCAHPGEISRIVTQTSSGTTGIPKRIYFTPEDQELTRDYFHHGMKIMVSPGDNVLILLPHKSPGSLGFLLQEGLDRLGAKGFFKDSLETDRIAPSHELENSPEDLAEGHICCNSKNTLLRFQDIAALVGPPSLIVAMAKEQPEIRPHSVLMTADFVAEEDRKTVKGIWGSKVFEHYGTTEMGLGCAMSCRDTEEHPPVGYHVRENDLYIEIIDANSGKVLPHGQWGEIVVTTLTRKGMPLLRYRTGDIGRWLKEPCICGSVLKRLDRIQKRTESKNISG